MNKSVYVVFSRTGTMFSNFIAFFTRDEYSHVSLSLDPTFQTMYSFGRLIPERPFPGGFVEENLYSGVYSMFPESKCLIYKVDITEDQYIKLSNNIQDFIDKKSNFKYNLSGTIRLYLNKPAKKENKYFCSQFVSELLINSDILTTDKCPELIKPMDLMHLENKQFIYEGIIKESTFDGNYDRQAVQAHSYLDEFQERLLFMFGKVKQRFLQLY